MSASNGIDAFCIMLAPQATSLVTLRGCQPRTICAIVCIQSDMCKGRQTLDSAVTRTKQKGMCHIREKFWIALLLRRVGYLVRFTFWLGVCRTVCLQFQPQTLVCHGAVSTKCITKTRPWLPNRSTMPWLKDVRNSQLGCYVPACGSPCCRTITFDAGLWNKRERIQGRVFPLSI